MRKASDVLNKIKPVFVSKRFSTSVQINGIEEAQSALRDDLLELVPKKKGDSPHHMTIYDEGYNTAIDQMEQAIREYFGESE